MFNVNQPTHWYNNLALSQLMYEKITGTRYSAKNLNLLQELKKIYQEELNSSPPIFWELNETHRPIYRINSKNWPVLLRQLSMQNKIGIFYYHSNLIVNYIAAYLNQRRNRWIGYGNPGDLLEQFMGEIICYTVHELATIEFNEFTIASIKNRINYLDRIYKHQAIFKFGLIKRTNNKFITMLTIYQQFHATMTLAAAKSVTQAVSTSLKICTNSLSHIVLNCANFVYYARNSTIDNQPLDIDALLAKNYVFTPDTTKKLYQALSKTHTGLMLYEFIVFAELDNLSGEVEPKNLLHILKNKAEYFTHEYTIKSFEFERRKADLPPWFNKQEQIAALCDYQAMLVCGLRLAMLQRMMTEATTFSECLGSNWNYHDQLGQMAIVTLLHLLTKELQNFVIALNKLYDLNNSKRHVYNFTQSFYRNETINYNFNQVDLCYNDLTKITATLDNTIQRLHYQLTSMHDTTPHCVSDHDKKDFYRKILICLNNYYPEEQTLTIPIIQALEQDRQPDHQTILESCKINTYLLNKNIFIDQKRRVLQEKLVINYPNEHLEFCAARNDFIFITSTEYTGENLKVSAVQLERCTRILVTQILTERPHWLWRNILWLLPWIFKDESLTIIDSIIQELNSILHELQNTIGDAEEPNLNYTNGTQ